MLISIEEKYFVLTRFPKTRNPNTQIFPLRFCLTICLMYLLFTRCLTIYQCYLLDFHTTVGFAVGLLVG